MQKLLVVLACAVLLLGCAGLEKTVAENDGEDTGKVSEEKVQARQAKATSTSWCNTGDQLEFEQATLSFVGVEDFESKSRELEGKLCHLTGKKGDVVADYYFNKAAVLKLEGKGEDVGSGCIVFSIEGSKAKTETCFVD